MITRCIHYGEELRKDERRTAGVEDIVRAQEVCVNTSAGTKDLIRGNNKMAGEGRSL